MKKLSDRQREVLDAIISFHDGHGYPPSIREIGAAVGIGSMNGVSDHLKALEKKGWVRRSPFHSRGMVVLRRPE